MIAAWAVHLLVLSTLLAAAALAAEGALRLYRRPLRWTWLAALWVPPLLPTAVWAWGRLPRAPEAAAGTPPPDGGVLVLPGLDLLPQVPAGPAALDGALGAAWLGSVLVAGLVVALGHRRVARRRRAWSRERVEGVDVWLSTDFGPAVVGVLRPRIVLPRWLLGLPPRELEATLVHEREHARAGDTRLLLAGLAPVLLAPWNPVGWWAFRRLREAVELDCDRRVLRRGVRLDEYGAALLAVGRRGGEGFLAAAALSEPPSFLERRLKMIVQTRFRRRLVRALGLTAVAGGLVVVACEMPTPTTPTGPPAVVEEGEAAPEIAVEGQRIYIRGSGALLAGDAPALFIDGRRADPSALDALRPEDIVRIEVVRSPAHRSFLPEEEAERRTGLIRITTRAHAEAEVERVEVAPTVVPDADGEPLPPPESGRGAAGADGPRLTRFDVQPEMRNRAEVLAAVGELYPPLLRDAGVGGRVVVWFRISATGEVVETRVAEGSGHAELDRAALEVARRAEFTPARNDGRPVAVWVQIPIAFSP